MSNEEKTTPDQVTTPETVVPATPEAKSDNVVPSWRLKEEADKRRTAEKKLAEIEAKDQAKVDADLPYKARYEKTLKEFDVFKEDTSKKGLHDEFMRQALELGFPSKIAKLGAPEGLSEDNMKDRLKEFTKEFKEFLPEAKKETPSPASPYAAVHPTTVSPAPQKDMTKVTGADVMKGLIDNANKK